MTSCAARAFGVTSSSWAAPRWPSRTTRGRRTGRVVYENDCLTVSAPSPEYLLATKLLASRVSRDEDDILTLYELCGFSSVDEGLEVLERYYRRRPIEAKVRFFLEDLLSQGRR